MNNIEFINNAYTEDGLRLPMIHFNSIEKDICVIFIHGMCQTIMDNYFATVWGNILLENNIGFLYEHNRGHSIENDTLMQDGSFARYGCMYEIFEDCANGDRDFWHTNKDMCQWGQRFLAHEQRHGSRKT